MDDEVFERLARQWKRDTSHLSNPSQIAAHPAYRAIVVAGADAVPLVFRDLRDHGGAWYSALRLILGDGPEIPREQSGRMAMIRELWLAWGCEHGYLKPVPSS